MSASPLLIDADHLRTFARAILVRAGLRDDDATVQAHVLVQADLRGVGSHGVLTLPRYVERLRSGVCTTQPTIRVVTETTISAVLDADHALGQLASVRGMEVAIAKARAQGIGLVGVTNSSHNGALAYYPMMALEYDLIGFCTTNAAPNMAADGSRGPVIGNNPQAWAIPAGAERPLVLDFAASAAARSKIILAMKQGTTIPLGWAVDADGQPTDDPRRAWEGSLLPTGGHKGFGLALVLEVLAGVLTGGPFGNLLPPVEDTAVHRQIGHFFLALDPRLFLPTEAFKARVDALIRQVKAADRAEGVAELLAPGERSARLLEQRRRAGIPLPPTVAGELQALADQMAVGLTLHDGAAR